MKNINLNFNTEKNKYFLISVLSLVCLSFVFLLINLYTVIRFGKVSQAEIFVGSSPTACDTTFSVVSDPTITPTPLAGLPFKKGIAGAPTLQALNQLNSAWFYNWAYYPVYKDNVANWDALVWQKFVPLFYGNAYASAVTQINQICTKRPEYCNGGYYLIGNEPDNVLEDGQRTTTLQEKVNNNVERYGLIMKAIKAKDINAKFIVFGLTKPDSAFINSFITVWSTRWNSDPVIANFYNSIQGIHVHTYSNYYECPTNDQGFKDFITAIGMPQEKELWVSEMGTLDNIPNPNDTTAAVKAERERFKQRMRCLVNTYHNSPVVTRYAWFYFGCNSAVHNYCPIPYASYNLMYPSGSGFSMSDIGLLYSTFPK